jgi:peptide/nickel transport system ATP-binding protein
MSDRILVMKDGRVVESGDADEVFLRPQHVYTRRLLTALPRLSGGGPARRGAGRSRSLAASTD